MAPPLTLAKVASLTVSRAQQPPHTSVLRLCLTEVSMDLRIDQSSAPNKLQINERQRLLEYVLARAVWTHTPRWKTSA